MANISKQNKQGEKYGWGGGGGGGEEAAWPIFKTCTV